MTAATPSPLTVDPTDDDPYIPITAACRYVPGRPHRSVPQRWASTGVIRHGERVRLRTIVSGGRRLTTRAWIDDFLGALNASNPTAIAPSAMTPARRTRQAASAMDALASMGVSAGK